MSLELSHHANTLNTSRRTGSFRSWIDPPRLSLTSLFVNLSQMSRASGSGRASRSSLVTTDMSPLGTQPGPTEARVDLG
jgi:hypothetical protein